MVTQEILPPQDPLQGLGQEFQPLENEPQNEPTEELHENDQYLTDRLGKVLLLIILVSGTTLLLIALLFTLQKLRSPAPLFF